jgi:HK97 family phage prohead protease
MLEKEIRLINIDNLTIETRSDSGDESEKMVVEGYAAVYDSETNIGGLFTERIEKGAFDSANMKDVPFKYNHSDAVPILARTRNKSLTLTPDEKGLKIRAELLDTTDGRDMFKRIKAGLLDKMSFAFSVNPDGEHWETDDNGFQKRTITKFDRIFDVSVVDSPAYDETEIYARSKAIADANAQTPDGAGNDTAEKRGLSETAKSIILLQGGKI